MTVRTYRDRKPVVAESAPKPLILDRGPDLPSATEVAPSIGTVLVVDDDSRIRKLVSVALERAGYDVVTAIDGLDALARVSDAAPDLIITDVMMPNMDGFRLLSYLRTVSETRAIPVLMLTARGGTDDIVNGLELGADDYLAKPFEMSELLARVHAKVERPPTPPGAMAQDRRTGLLGEQAFRGELSREIMRSRRSRRPGCLAYLQLDELALLRARLGQRSDARIARRVAALVDQDALPLEMLGRDTDGRFLILMPETDSSTAYRRLQLLVRRITESNFDLGSEHVRFTPNIGFAEYDADSVVSKIVERARLALAHAAHQLDLDPKRYVAEVNRPATPAASVDDGRIRTSRSSRRTLVQIALTQLASIVIPFCVYVALASRGINIVPVVYIVVVLALVTTAVLIWAEGICALRPQRPPREPGSQYPPASAIIAAYLPNEAATIIDTIEAFQRLDYPGPLQIILAYNTPRSHPVEEELRQIASLDSRFIPIRVDGSGSKAQNVNAALGVADGEFIGVFDADHHPDPDNFTRAWRWLSNGYDVVQGHCLVRNGDESWIARVVAVEFESIYAVSHPGRTRLHGFGIFGGSNGYWRADLLRQTRMHGFMLTEDIDSSMRVIQQGYRIATDPKIVSRELAPVTLTALWNQRLRWAQGWFQVAFKHTWRGLRSQTLTPRQKAGLVYLLAWREIYPWISMQMIPIMLFWIWQYGFEHINWVVPLWLMTTLFTQSAGPGQLLFTYRLADEQIQQRGRWFLFYLVVGIFAYTWFKNIVTLVAQAKQVMRESSWEVTPRTAREAEQS